MEQSVNQLINFFVPENYDLTLNVDRVGRQFSGVVKIRGTQVSDEIRLHSKGLKISRATVDGKKTEVKKYENDEIGLGKFASTKKASREIILEFTGKIADGLLHGLYPCYYELDGEKKELLATQFESHHAREVFPCVDEPAAKATFDLTLITENGVEVLGNMPVALQEPFPQGKGKMTTKFATTPKMSTYLLAFVIGDLQKKTTRTKSGVEVNVYATPAQKPESLDFALNTAVRCIDFYNKYFDVRYPLPKSDHIALPDFGSGAMENWGLVTYRETCLLADENTGLASRQYIATVIAHELSHQWFGNLVTMKWWDDLWLNESFASLCEHIATDALFPDWEMWLGYETGDVVVALRRDALPGVQAVRSNVHHPDEISTLFDPAIVYAKGERLLKMCRAFVGEDNFRAGLQKYFKKFAYQNTEANDLWMCLSEASGQDIASLMTPWLTQPGYPIITADLVDKKIVLRQEQFFLAAPEKYKIVLLHGTNGYPENNWFPMLKEELEQQGHQVFAPKLPVGLGDQSLDNWCAAIREQLPWEFDENTVLIGHSCGATYMLSILNQKRKMPLRASIFVSGFAHDLNNPDFTEYIKTFVDLDFDWQRIRQNAGQIAVFAGTGDPYVPLTEAKNLAKNLCVDLNLTKDGGHFCDDTGTEKYPELVEEILKTINMPNPRIWPIPLFSIDKNAPKLMSEREISFTPANVSNFQLNQCNNAHFITTFGLALWSAIGIKLTELETVERFAILGQVMLMARSARLSVTNELYTLNIFHGEKNWAVWDALSMIIADLKMFVETDKRAEKNLKKLVGDMARPRFKALGVRPKTSDSLNDVKLRPTIISHMVYAEDRAAIDACLAEFSAHRHDLTAINGDLRTGILSAVVKFGDQETFDYLLDAYKTTVNADLKQDLSAALAAARDADQIDRLIQQLTLTDIVRPQDIFYWFALLLSNKYARTKVWAWCRNQWPWIEQTFGNDKSFDMFPRCAGSRLVTAKELREFDEFFASKMSEPALARVIVVGHTDITTRVNWIKRDSAGLLEELKR